MSDFKVKMHQISAGALLQTALVELTDPLVVRGSFHK